MLRRGILRLAGDVGRNFPKEVSQQVLSVEGKAKEIYCDIEQLDKFNILPSARGSLPMVLLLGNHSSGKSSFINYILGQKEQETGVAPTDDGFTVILPSETKADKDGPTLMSDPAMDFSELRKFGPRFVNHLKLKQRNLGEKGVLPEGLMLVDSPGMIDTPTAGRTSTEDRGYDFLKAVKWFAERSDVVLLLFDPNNPGTTGETLSVLTESLNGMEHKLMIILNKVDQVTQVHDFARSYGSLCWNLAKVIPRKDLPRIYTMFTPVGAGAPGQASKVDGPTTPEVLSQADMQLVNQENVGARVAESAIPLRSFNATRDEVIGEVLRAPHRRIDNLVTQLEDSIFNLIIMSRMQNEVHAWLRRRNGSNIASIALFGSLVPALPAASFFLGLPMAAAGAATLAAGVTTAILFTKYKKDLTDQRSVLEKQVESIFRDRIATTASGNMDLTARWQRIRSKFIQNVIKKGDLQQLKQVPSRHIARLEAHTSGIRSMRAECNVIREACGKMAPSEFKLE